jgi:hypothetical protein
METERIAWSQRERDRLRVLHEVEQGHLTQVAVAGRIHLCDRQVRRLLLRLRERGDRAAIHGLRGRPSNRKLAARFEQKILARVRQSYADFGPTLVTEHLAKEGLVASRETTAGSRTLLALTPEEIAVSIVAELIAIRRNAKNLPHKAVDVGEFPALKHSS